MVRVSTISGFSYGLPFGMTTALLRLFDVSKLPPSMCAMPEFPSAQRR